LVKKPHSTRILRHPRLSRRHVGSEARMFAILLTAIVS
jgi:hypothetical protein